MEELNKLLLKSSPVLSLTKEEEKVLCEHYRNIMRSLDVFSFVDEDGKTKKLKKED